MYSYNCIALFLSASAQSQPQFRLKSLVREDFAQVPQFKWIIEDSVEYYYPSNHTGVIDWQWADVISFGHDAFYCLTQMHPSLVYDSAVCFRFGDNKTVSQKKSLYQQFDVSDKLVNFSYYPPNGQTSNITNYVYQGNDLIEVSTKDYKYLYKYKNGLLDSILKFNSAGIKTVNAVYSYTANGLLARELRVDVYGAGDSVIKDYTYDGNGRMVEMLRHGKWLSRPYDTLEVQKYQFSSGGDLVMQESFSSSSYLAQYGYTSKVKPLEKRIHTYDQNHNKLETITYINDDTVAGLDHFSKRTYTYGNNGLLTKLEMLNWGGDQYIRWPDTGNERGGAHIINFNYELFWPANVNKVEKKATAIKIYPSPASDFIRVETSWTEVKPFVVTISNMQGRIVRKWEEPATKNYARTIPLTELPSGVYILKMRCGDEEVAKQFALYK